MGVNWFAEGSSVCVNARIGWGQGGREGCVSNLCCCCCCRRRNCGRGMCVCVRALSMCGGKRCCEGCAGSPGTLPAVLSLCMYSHVVSSCRSCVPLGCTPHCFAASSLMTAVSGSAGGNTPSSWQAWPGVTTDRQPASVVVASVAACWCVLAGCSTTAAVRVCDAHTHAHTRRPLGASATACQNATLWLLP